MKRWIAWIVITLVLLVVLAPARVLYWLPLPANMVLNELDGSLWDGRAGTLQLDGVWLNNVQWQLQPLALLSGQLSVAITVPVAANSISGEALVSSGFGGLQVSHLQADGQLAALLQLANTQLPLKSQGNWQLDISDFKVSDPNPTQWCNVLKGNATGRNIQVLVNGAWQSLGDFPVGLGCADSGAVTLSMTGDNNLGLALEGAINSQDIDINGTVRPNARTPEGLAKLFEYLGQPDSQGRYSFSL